MSSGNTYQAPGILDPESRPALVGLVVVAVALAVARMAGPGQLGAALAAALLVGVPYVALQLGERGGGWFLLGSAIGAWAVLKPWPEAVPLALPVLLLHRAAYFAVPPLVVRLMLGESGRSRLKLTPAHLYAPAAVMGLAALVHLVVRWGSPSAEAEIRKAAFVYIACYVVLLVVALLLRVPEKKVAPALAPVNTNRAAELEETGRFGVAAMVHERAGDLGKAAEASQRAGDWERAAKLYGRSGDSFNAGEMYYRAGMLPEALDHYQRARAFPAAARLCVQLGHTERAISCYELAGDWAAVVDTIEKAGRTPTADQYRKAGMLERAATKLRESGDWLRAASIYEHDLHDPARAAALHLEEKSYVYAGRLLESAGRLDEALQAFSATPAGAVDAARLHSAAGRGADASALLAEMPVGSLDTIKDDASLALVAKAMIAGGRTDDAVRILQGIKRRGAADGRVRLLLGSAFLGKDLHEMAETELRAATSMPLDPEDEMRAAYLLGCVLEAGGNKAEARGLFQGLLEKDLDYEDVEERYRRLK